MSTVLGMWEIGYHAPVSEQYYWSLPLRDFGITEWNMVPVSGIKNAETKVQLNEWVGYEAFFEEHPDLKRVFLEPRTDHQNPATVWLHDFDHPEDCVYVFGSAHYNPTIAHCREGDSVVSIKSENDKGVFWADQCACIVLYDRMVKSWQ